MAFESLSEKITGVFKRLKNKGKLSESDVKTAMREVRLALLEADVNYKVAKDFTNKITERAVGEKVMESLTPAQMVIKLVNEELVSLMGGDSARLEFSSKPPTVIMMCGLQGSGKTTHSGKLAKMLKAQNHRPLLVACDIYRPAAIEQLKVVGKNADVPVFEMGKEDPVKIAEKAIKHAKDYGHDIVILDTAGRLHIDEELMGELERVKGAVNPAEILLVIDSMTGQ
ncbi:MAG: signal recognition particle receptor subunit alpha, partial [Ruminococcus sp.]|nr:signal recognition particle receptor subunit alpha [Ruminococcus sp.]